MRMGPNDALIVVHRDFTGPNRPERELDARQALESSTYRRLSRRMTPPS